MSIRIHHVVAVLVLLAFGAWLRFASRTGGIGEAPAPAAESEPPVSAVVEADTFAYRNAPESGEAERPAPVAATPRDSTSTAIRPPWDTEIVGTNGGSAVPCAVPLPLRVARIDGEFGLDIASATTAIERAVALWESAVGRPLFRMDPDSGFPIRFVYDDRQAMVQERNRMQAAYEAEAERLRRWREDLTERDQRQARLQVEYSERWRAFETRLDAHNRMVDRLNQQGGVPEAIAMEIATAAGTLEFERQALQDEARELQAARQRIQEEVNQFNRAAAAHRGQGSEIERRFPMVRVESGRYREALRTRDDDVVDVSREIQIFRYSDPNELVLLIAHELGHALGMAHAADPTAVMSEEHMRTGLLTVTPSLHPADMALFRSTCPDLFSD